MRHAHLGFLGLLSFTGAVIVAAATGCTAAGSSTIFVDGDGGGSEGGSPFVFEDSGSTTKEGGGAVDYDALFGPPATTKTSPNSLTGTWAGTDNSGEDTRLMLDASSLVLAKKCTTTAVGITVAAQITTSSIKTLESKSAGSAGTCQVEVRPMESVRCVATTPSAASTEGDQTTGGCFLLSGTSLRFYGTFLGGTELTKLSD
jgi:hypothetical protein